MLGATTLRIFAIAAAAGSAVGAPAGRCRAGQAQAAAGAAAVSRSVALPPRIAITIDDLPWVGPLAPGDTKEAATARLLAALARHGVPAAGFVNSERHGPPGPELDLWLDAGLELGNHSANHRAIDRAPLDEWLDDVRRCDAFLRETTGRAPRYFRFPFLQQGRTAARRDSAAAALAGLGYRTAHVSVDTADWLLARAYGETLDRNDGAAAARRAEIVAAYVRHVVACVRHYQEFARKEFGRDVAHILLLHANALNADHLDSALGALEGDGFRFVALEEALADSVYRLPDRYAGPIGLSFLYRVRPAAPDAWAWDSAQADSLEARFARAARN
jgi:peptidoglycan/xylan/chitin deacetylase (PgdA/CDA1 family)